MLSKSTALRIQSKRIGYLVNQENPCVKQTAATKVTVSWVRTKILEKPWIGSMNSTDSGRETLSTTPTSFRRYLCGIKVHWHQGIYTFPTSTIWLFEFPYRTVRDGRISAASSDLGVDFVWRCLECILSPTLQSLRELPVADADPERGSSSQQTQVSEIHALFHSAYGLMCTGKLITYFHSCVVCVCVCKWKCEP